MIYKIFAEIYLILPHSGSQKRQNWDEVKWGKMRLTPPPPPIFLSKCRQRGGGMIHFVNSRVARDTVWELEGSMWYSQGTGGEHVMQSGN